MYMYIFMYVYLYRIYIYRYKYNNFYYKLIFESNVINSLIYSINSSYDYEKELSLDCDMAMKLLVG